MVVVCLGRYGIILSNKKRIKNCIFMKERDYILCKHFYILDWRQIQQICIDKYNRLYRQIQQIGGKYNI